MVSAAVRLTRPQAAAVCDQFLETALFRGWDLRAVAVMANHVHLVVGVPGDPEPDSLLRDFKSYASRRLNCQFGRQPRWWTQSGSTRILPNQEATESAVEYVKAQEYPLVVWVAEGERPA
jgi:REP element-mobilizing transposase RayT